MILARGCVAALLALAAGCAAGPAPRPAWPVPPPAAIELTRVPFFEQRQDQCGPAALATVLVHAGRDVTPDVLRPAVFVPGRRGSLQPELLAASRRYGAIPYRIEPSLVALHAAVASGHPVLVMQNLGIPSVPYWHYAVVVGIDAGAQRVLLRSGRDRRRVMRDWRFDDSWRWAGRWGFVLLEPGRDAIPAWAEEGEYLAAVASLEAVPGQRGVAETAYRGATERWPGSSLAWLGLGNVLYAQGRRGDARTVWQKAVDAAPDAPVPHNNLATVLGELGCRAAARAAAQRAVHLAQDGPFEAEARRTLAEVNSSSTVDSTSDAEGCGPLER